MHWIPGTGIVDGSLEDSLILSLCSICDLLILYLIIGGVANDHLDG